MNLTKESQLEGFVTEMLNRLGVEYFDYLWLHAINDANYHRSYGREHKTVHRKLQAILTELRENRGWL